MLALSEAVQITEADEVASLLIRLFEGYDKTLLLLKASIEYEVRYRKMNELYKLLI